MIAGATALLTGPDSRTRRRDRRGADVGAGQSIAGGTDEIQKNILAEKVLGLPGEIRPDEAFRSVRSSTAAKSVSIRT